MDTEIVDAFEKLIAGEVTPTKVREIEGGGDPRSVWDSIEASGFLDLLVGEAGKPATEHVGTSAGIAFLCGKYAVPVPLWETLVARAVLTAAQHAVPERPISAGIATAGSPCLQAAAVPFAAHPCDVLLLTADGIRLCSNGKPSDGAHASPFSLARDLSFGPADVARVDGDVRRVHAMLALHAAADIAGAADRALSLTLAHAAERKQFGRPLGAFQAIQQALAVAAEHASGAHTGFMMGARYWERDDQRDWHGDATGVFESAACAMYFAGVTAAEVARVAHAVFGAMGVAAETDLGLHTRRMHELSQAFGGQAYWAERLGASARVAPEPDLLSIVRRIVG